MIIITLGDPYSVNAECVARVLASSTDRWRDHAVTLVGSRYHWDEQVRSIAGALRPTAIDAQDLTNPSTRGLRFVDIGDATTQRPTTHLSARDRGLIAVRSLNVLPAGDPTRRLAVLTSPIDKAACAAAGFGFDGHTEFFESRWKCPAIMTLAGPRLRVGLVTNHASLRSVPDLITNDLVSVKIALLARTLRETLNIDRPRIAVCGLNPHCGDGGLFGDEDSRVIAPAIDSARRDQTIAASISGPIPADTAFHRAISGQFDAVLAMYHDQGLGPLKAVHFDEAVNISGGLPHLRVSPDHGPAADLFGTGLASIRSFQAAFDLCLQHVAPIRGPEKQS